MSSIFSTLNLACARSGDCSNVFIQTKNLKAANSGKKLTEMIDHMEDVCMQGRKYLPGEKPLLTHAKLEMYVNDFVIGDHSNVAILNGKKLCFINHNIINIITTHDEAFCNYSYDFIKNIIKKSTQISNVGERERVIFFNMIRQRIDMYQGNEIKTLSKMRPYY